MKIPKWVTNTLAVVGAILVGVILSLGVITLWYNVSLVWVKGTSTQLVSNLIQRVPVPVATKPENGTPPKPTPKPTVKKVPTVEVVEPTVEDSEGDLFPSPVQATDWFNEESKWLIAEPGVILDNTAAWTIPSTKDTWYANVPEGGFTYFSMGEGRIVIAGVEIVMPGAKGLNYLVLIRGRIDDGIVDSDLNETAEISDFVPGHAIWAIMPPGAYVSKNWFRQQLVVSTTTGGTNCGATGCSMVHVVLVDVDSHLLQKFEVKAKNIDAWALLA
jgi:hypothetical protein